jgi:hypothetical protein
MLSPAKGPELPKAGKERKIRPNRRSTIVNRMGEKYEGKLSPITWKFAL